MIKIIIFHASLHIGKTYGEYRKSLSVNRVLIGILENTGNFYYRRKEALSEAQKNPDVKKKYWK